MPSSESKDITVIINDTLRQKFLEILKNNAILDEVDTITMKEPAALKGQNMGSSSVYVEIKFKDPEINPKNLFVKKFLDNSPGHTAMLKKENVMEKETEFLRDVLPWAREFCKKYPGCERFLDCFPKCLYGDEDMVVMENLVLDDSFVMLPKEDFQDLHTAKFVLTNLAKFHASTSVLLGEIGLEKFSNQFKLTARDLLAGPVNQMMVQMINNTVITTITLLKNNPVDGAKNAIEKLKKFIGKGEELKDECIKNKSLQGEKFTCINHGDCWNNNMLFKVDQETGKVFDQMFVDLQVTRIASQNYDVCYYLYLSVKSEVLRMHLKELLQHYYDQFKEAVEGGFGKKCRFTFEEFIDDFKSRKGYAFFLGLGALPLVHAMKYVDLKEMGSGSDAGDMANLFTEAIDKWILESPIESKKLAEETVKNVNFFFDGFP